MLQRMVAQMTRLVTGSSQSQPVQMISAADTTTPSETAASAAMCRKAPSMLMSSLRPLANSMRGNAVDEDADAGDHHHGDARDRLRVAQTQDRLPADRAGRDQQEHRVRQRGENRRSRGSHR